MQRSLPTGNIIDPLSLNYYTYCANNPILYCDPSGNAWETVFDVISLGVSIAEAVNDPTNGWLWIGVAADAVDLIPFVTGVGEVTRAVRITDNVSDTVDNIHDAGKIADAADGILDNGKTAQSIGKYIDVNESMGDVSRDYQTFITGQTNKAYLVNGVKFDGITPDGVLIDAKGRYSQFLDKNGEFKPWFTGEKGFVGQASRQIEAANGTPITWYFLEEKVMNSTVELFERNGITEIKCIYMPFK